MPDVRRILCPIDFSEASRAALDQAAAIAEWFGAGVTAVHVAPRSSAIAGPMLFAALPAGAVTETAASRAQRALIEYVRPLRAKGLPIDAIALEGEDVDLRILALADSLHVDLIVMGTHGRTGLDWLIVGSVTDKVLRQASCPVLTVPPSATRHALPPFKRILCPVDFSEQAREALSFALMLAQEGDARLTVLHVLADPVPHETFASMDTPAARRRCEAAARVRLDALVPSETRAFCDPRSLVAWGAAPQTIVAVADTETSDLIVMGIAKHGVLDRILHGSTAGQVIRHATCPVLTLRS